MRWTWCGTRPLPSIAWAVCSTQMPARTPSLAKICSSGSAASWSGIARRQPSSPTSLIGCETPPTPPASILHAIVVRREADRPLVIRVLPVGGAAGSPFLGARALLVFTDLGRKPGPDPGVVARVFDLTRAEARLAALVATGTGPGAAAKKLGVSRETVRAQLKAVFAKTETHRQSELVALLLRLASLVFAALSLELGII